MLKKQIILLANTDSSRVKYFSDVVSDTYEISITKSVDETLNILSQNMEDYVAIVVDNPSGVDKFDCLNKYVEDANNYLFALPIIILTDVDNRINDENYLEGATIGYIEKGTLERVVLQRIEKSIAMVNSITFSEFSEMLKALPSLIYLKDNKGRYVFCSKYMSHLKYSDNPNWSIKGHTDLEIRKDIENAKMAYKNDLNIIKTGVGSSYIIEEDDGDKKEYLQLIKEPIKDKQGSVKGIIAIINNVTEQELLKKELRRKSITDELTGLYNRAFYNEYLKLIDKDYYPISVITGDCDGLKIINDVYGHNVGDEYILIAARLFKACLPSSAVIFRMGGDEFMAILPKTSESEAKQLVLKMKESEKETKIMDRPYSISLGSATVNSHYNPLIDCINASDLEMYKEKRNKKKKQK